MRPTLLVLGLAAALVSGVLPASAQEPGSERTQHRLVSWDGHEVPVTLYRPWGADAARPAPVLLHSHGWSGSRTNADGAFQPYIDAGFGVVSIDMRGHGEARSTSEARVHHVDYEIKDVGTVIDWVATLDWVLLDAPGDARLGALGGSYGGAYQLLAAALDGRLDALAPEITWNDLVQALAPNQAPKSAWVDVLYGAGNALARVHPDIHQAFAYVQATNRLPDGTAPGTPDLASQFAASSPGTYPGAIDVPTLLIQGMPDTLFNFNQAAANYAQVRATGAPARLVTHLGGHLLNAHAINGNLPDAGLQPDAGPHPCGSTTDLVVAWYQRHLLGNESVDVAPAVCIALDDGTAITGNDYPLAPAPVHIALAAGATLVQGAPSPPFSETVLVAETESIVAGVPVLRGRIETTATDAIVYWSLHAWSAATGEARVVDSQVTPLRASGDLGGTAASFEIELGGIGVRLHPGDELRLVASTSSDQFAHNGGREPGLVTVSGLAMSLPVVRPGAEPCMGPDLPGPAKASPCRGGPPTAPPGKGKTDAPDDEGPGNAAPPPGLPDAAAVVARWLARLA